MTVGLTVGSRGIQNILTMLEVAVQAVRGCGASPVLLAAMGSHGGGTRQGQKDVLDSLGITEEQLEAQASTGGDLVIPLEKYAKAVATVPDFAAAIANDRRLTADGYTRNEKAAFDEEMALNMQRAVEVARQEREVKDQFDAETKAIYEEALELRKAAGMVDNAAASDALGMSAAFTNPC